MPSHAASSPQIIATSSAALQTFSSLFSHTSQHQYLDANDRSMNRSQPRRESQLEEVSCQDSYRLFKKCSMARGTEGFSCSDTVASYMRCALNGCEEREQAYKTDKNCSKRH
mmetsp:Transcript_20588/g.37175  ORF Transcript_20588/g.37175 Transcript_20588/m.37175 type:complete len:112 (+) Transcript_20588:111-446(+)